MRKQYLLALLVILAASAAVHSQPASQSNDLMINMTEIRSGGGNFTSSEAYGHVLVGSPIVGVSTGASYEARYGLLHTTNRTFAAQVNTAPSNTTIISPENNSVVTQTNFSVQYSANDTELDDLTFYLYLDGEFNQSNTGNTTLNLSTGNYSVTVQAFDGSLFGPNTTHNFSVEEACVSTWECTGWVENGTYEFRTCTDTSSCPAPQSPEKPETQRVVSDFFVATSIIMAAILIFTYQASVHLNPEKHSALRMGMFYAALGIGWAALNYVMLMASEFGASSLVQDSIVTVYTAYTIAGVLAVIYLGIRFFQFTFMKMLALARSMTKDKKGASEDDEPW